MSQKEKDLNLCLMLLKAWGMTYHANITVEVEEIANMDDDDPDEE